MSEEEYQFGLGLRDLSVSKHWRELPRDYSFLNHKTVLILPGSGTRSAKDANGMCKIAESMLNENIKNSVNICSLYYPRATEYREGAAARALFLLDEYIIPLVSSKNKEGDLVKIDAKSAAKNLRNLVIFTHCYGSYMVEILDEKLFETLKSLNYTPEEQKNIQRQLVVIHHNCISDNMGRLDLHSTNLYRHTQADERCLPTSFKNDGFQFFVQKEALNDDEALYVKIAENQRVLLVSHVSEYAEDEHNNAYWSENKKTEGGIKERRIFDLIFNEAVTSSYQITGIEDFIRQAANKAPDAKDILTESLKYGKEFGDEYEKYRSYIYQNIEELKVKQQANQLKEKEIKNLSPEILLYMDNKEKTLLDYAIEENNVMQAKILWNNTRKFLPKDNQPLEDTAIISYNHKMIKRNNKVYLQKMLKNNNPEMFVVLAKGSDDLPRLDYSVANDKMLLTAAKVYAGLPAKTEQLDKLYYYKSLIYMYSRIEKMPETEEGNAIKGLLEAKIFTKANAKDMAVKHKIKSYASQYGVDSLIKKSQQVWEKNLVESGYKELCK